MWMLLHTAQNSSLQRCSHRQQRCRRRHARAACPGWSTRPLVVFLLVHRSWASTCTGAPRSLSAAAMARRLVTTALGWSVVSRCHCTLGRPVGPRPHGSTLSGRLLASFTRRPGLRSSLEAARQADVGVEEINHVSPLNVGSRAHCCIYLGCASASITAAGRMGRCRSRAPTAAKMALPMAGPTTVVRRSVSQEAAGGLAKNGSVLAASEGYLNVSQKLQNAHRIWHGVWPLRA